MGPNRFSYKDIFEDGNEFPFTESSDVQSLNDSFMKPRRVDYPGSATAIEGKLGVGKEVYKAGLAGCVQVKTHEHRIMVPTPLADSILQTPFERLARSLIVERPNPFLTVCRSNPWPLS